MTFHRTCLLACGLTVLAAACADKVPKDVYPIQCRQRLDLANVAKPVVKEDPVPAVKARHEAEEKSLSSSRENALASVERELEAALTANVSGNPWVVRQEFVQKRQQVNEEFRAKLRDQRERQEKEMNQALDEKRRLDEAVTRMGVCTNRFTREEPRLPKIECQRAATSLAAFDACRDPFGTSYTERCLSRTVPEAVRQADTLKERVPGCTLELENLVVD